MSQTKVGSLPSICHRGPFVELRQSVSSRVEAISPFVNQLMVFIRRFGNRDESETGIEIALHEALTNAVIHGNREDPDKRVYVVCLCSTDGEVSITIRDQGQGFDSRAVPDPTDSDNLLAVHGRGVYLMRALMDEVCFEEGGWVVHMRKEAKQERNRNSSRTRLELISSK